jgi:hypothetical protein
MASILSVLAANAYATVIVPADLAELSREAQIIARGDVVSVDARWTDDRRTIETIVTLQTGSYLKGQLGPILQFRVPGGTLGRLRNLIIGAPRFEEGQQVVVFLGVNGPRMPYVLGLNQGVYRVGLSPSGEAVVSPPPIMPGVSGPVVRGTEARVPAPLAAFERSVRALVEVR